MVVWSDPTRKLIPSISARSYTSLLWLSCIELLLRTIFANSIFNL